MEYLINHFLRVLENYSGIIKSSIKQTGARRYELQLFDMPALLDMELIKAELVEYTEEAIEWDRYGRVLKTKTVRNAYPVCESVTDKEKYHLKTILEPQDCAKKLIEIDCAIRRCLKKHSHI